jgi:hypothetical protein
MSKDFSNHCGCGRHWANSIVCNSIVNTRELCQRCYNEEVDERESNKEVDGSNLVKEGYMPLYVQHCVPKNPLMGTISGRLENLNFIVEPTIESPVTRGHKTDGLETIDYVSHVIEQSPNEPLDLTPSPEQLEREAKFRELVKQAEVSLIRSTNLPLVRTYRIGIRFRCNEKLNSVNCIESNIVKGFMLCKTGGLVEISTLDLTEVLTEAFNLLSIDRASFYELATSAFEDLATLVEVLNVEDVGSHLIKLYKEKLYSVLGIGGGEN